MEEITEKINKIITIKPIPRAGKRLGLGDQPENFMRMPGTQYTWVPSKKGSVYLTGLTTEEEINYGKELGQDLSNRSSFWGELKFVLTEKPMGLKLNLSVAQEYVVYKAMTKSELVAESLQDYKTGKKPYAEWYIENIEAEAEEKAKLAEIKVEAYAKFAEISEEKKRNVAKILGLKVYGLSKTAAAGKLFDYLEQKKEHLTLFLNTLKLNDEELAVATLVEDCINFNFIRKNKHLDFQYGEEVLGSTKGHLIQKLISPDYQSLRLKLSQLVETRR